MRIPNRVSFKVVSALFAIPAFAAVSPTSGDTVGVSVNWTEIARVSETSPTTQHLASSYTLRSNPLNKPLLKALRDLHTDDTRMQLWFTLPHQVVPELQEPTASKTFWNFQYVDPVVTDYFTNTSGKHHLNVGTIPRWMFNVPPIEIPTDPGISFHSYTKGTTGALLKDPTGRQFAEYQARVFSWYTQGGFTDEVGQYHKSGHHYKIDYWGVLNEPDFENKIAVEQYTKIYDAVTDTIHRIDPSVQFFGPEIADTQIPWAKYFLNPKNHRLGSLPVQWFSFQNYVSAPNDPTTWQVKFFSGHSTGDRDGDSAQAFADKIHQVAKIRDELSPKTKLVIDELGTFNLVKPGENPCNSTEPYQAYNPRYWVAIGANWAGNFITAENAGIQIFSMSQMIGYPTQCLSITMVNWDTAHPNAHYWILKLVNSNFGPGDKLVHTQSSSNDVMAQASITHAGRKILLVNTSNRKVIVSLGNTFKEPKLRAQIVDESSGEQPPQTHHVVGGQVTLAPFAVAIVSQ